MSKEHQKYQSKIQKIRRNFSLTEVSTSKVAVVNPFIPSIYLPSSLFCRPKKKARKAAKGRMDVTSAKVSERASSTPSSELKRKTIIVTARAFNAFIAKWEKNPMTLPKALEELKKDSQKYQQYKRQQRLILVKQLQAMGFDVFVKANKKGSSGSQLMKCPLFIENKGSKENDHLTEMKALLESSEDVTEEEIEEFCNTEQLAGDEVAALDEETIEGFPCIEEDRSFLLSHLAKEKGAQSDINIKYSRFFTYKTMQELYAGKREEEAVKSIFSLNKEGLSFQELQEELEELELEGLELEKKGLAGALKFYYLLSISFKKEKINEEQLVSLLGGNSLSSGFILRIGYFFEYLKDARPSKKLRSDTIKTILELKDKNNKSVAYLLARFYPSDLVELLKQLNEDQIKGILELKSNSGYSVVHYLTGKFGKEFVDFLKTFKTEGGEINKKFVKETLKLDNGQGFSAAIVLADEYPTAFLEFMIDIKNAEKTTLEEILKEIAPVLLKEGISEEAFGVIKRIEVSCAGMINHLLKSKQFDKLHKLSNLILKEKDFFSPSILDKIRCINEFSNQEEMEASKKIYKKIYIQSGGNQMNLGSANSGKVTMVMEETGEVLNNPKEIPRLRSDIVRCTIAEDENLEGQQKDEERKINITESSIKPARRNSDPSLIKQKKSNYSNYNETKEGCKKKQNGDEVYAELHLMVPKSEIKFLPCYGIDDEILAFKTEPENAEVEVFKDNDTGAFYVQNKSEGEVKVSYIIKSQTEEKALDKYKEIPKNDKFKKIVEQFIGIQKGKEAIREVKTVADLKEIYEKRIGVCRHFVLAVCYQAQLKGIGKQVRIVCIDNNHVRAEYFYKGEWIAVPDLGGGESATLIYKNKDKKREEEKQKKPEEVQQEPSKTPAKEERYFNIKEALEQFNDEDKRVLLTASDAELDGLTDALVKDAKTKRRKVFVIDSADAIDVFRYTFFLDKSKNGSRIRDGHLSAFLEDCDGEAQQQSSPLIILRADQLSANDKVRFNELLDLHARVNGRLIPDRVQIITLETPISQQEMRTRGAFISRHGKYIKVQHSAFKNRVLPKPPTTQGSTTPQNKTIEIDFCGQEDWRSVLFGFVNVDKNKPVWQSSSFSEELAKKRTKPIIFKFTNLPKIEGVEAAIKKEILRAYAAGSFNYHGYELKLDTKKVFFEIDNSPFNFEEFKVDISQNVSLNKATLSSSDLHIINPYLFDDLIYKIEVSSNGKYTQAEGLLEANKNKKLSLYISHPLSEHQWYYLFKKAREHSVTLDLYTGKGVAIPQVAPENMVEGATVQQQVRSLKVTFTDSVPAMLKLKEDDFKGKTIIRVEDYTSRELLYGPYDIPKFDVSKGEFNSFTKHKSLLAQFGPNDEVVLAGEFDEQLIMELMSLLQEPRSNEFKGFPKVTLLVENKVGIKEIFSPFLENEELREAICETKSETPIKEPWLEKEFGKNLLEGGLEEVEEKAGELEGARIALIRDALKENYVIHLEGPAGIGKSYLMKLYAEGEKENVSMHHGLESIEEWAEAGAEDDSTKESVLVLDEANVDDTHYTRFSFIFNEDPNKRVIYDRKSGKKLIIGPHCKIVFIGNPPVDENGQKYGGGRSDNQKFFLENADKILKVNLQRLPDYYIYQRLLKEMILDPFNKKKPGKINEQDFFKHAKVILEKYNENKTLTPRFVQREMLLFVAKKIEKFPKKAKEIKNDDFHSNNVTAQVQLELEKMLFISEQQFNGQLPYQVPGTPGFLLEGDPGAGKSAMIGAVLKNQGIAELSIKDALKATPTGSPSIEDGKQRYIKIPAGLDIERKKELVTYAYRQGHIVWIDELNSCIDDGFEKILNAATTGENPTTGQNDTKNGGFRVLATMNSSGHKGRSIIGKALKSRMVQQAMPSFNEYKKEQNKDALSNLVTHLVHIYHPNFDESGKAALITNVIAEIEKGSIQNFRDLKERIKNNDTLAKIYTQSLFDTEVKNFFTIREDFLLMVKEAEKAAGQADRFNLQGSSFVDFALVQSVWPKDKGPLDTVSFFNSDGEKEINGRITTIEHSISDTNFNLENNKKRVLIPINVKGQHFFTLAMDIEYEAATEGEGETTAGNRKIKNVKAKIIDSLGLGSRSSKSVLTELNANINAAINKINNPRGTEEEQQTFVNIKDDDIIFLDANGNNSCSLATLAVMRTLADDSKRDKPIEDISKGDFGVFASFDDAKKIYSQARLYLKAQIYQSQEDAFKKNMKIIVEAGVNRTEGDEVSFAVSVFLDVIGDFLETCYYSYAPQEKSTDKDIIALARIKLRAIQEREIKSDDAKEITEAVDVLSKACALHFIGMHDISRSVQAQAEYITTCKADESAGHEANFKKSRAWKIALWLPNRPDPTYAPASPFEGITKFSKENITQFLKHPSLDIKAFVGVLDTFNSAAKRNYSISNTSDRDNSWYVKAIKDVLSKLRNNEDTQEQTSGPSGWQLNQAIVALNKFKINELKKRYDATKEAEEIGKNVRKLQTKGTAKKPPRGKTGDMAKRNH